MISDRIEGRLRQFRVQIIYFWRHRSFVDLDNPRLLTEHVQRRKLNDRDPRYPRLADKILAKDHVGACLGARWVVPTLWHGSHLPMEAVWPMPFVVKSRHGCGHFSVVRDAADYRKVQRRSKRWMRSRYGAWLDEWLYGEIAPGLLVEPFLGTGQELPIDYKVFVFGGRAHYVQVHLGRGTDHRWIVFDLEWQRVSAASADANPPRPRSLDQMIVASERLGAEFDFVRADFYEVAGLPLFGELTFYPGSGLEPLEPPELNAQMGAWWSDSRARGSCEP